MASPLGLTIKTNLESMGVGDCIPCRYTALTSGAAGYFSELGTCVANEIPVTGTATPDGLFYLIKTAKGTLIADRVIQTSISWSILNTAKYIEGNPMKETNALPVMTSNTNPIGKVTASSIYSSDYDSYLAFNGSIDEYGWISKAAATISSKQWLQYEFSMPISIYSYEMVARKNNDAPKDWTFEGSNDGTNWVILDTQTNQINWSTTIYEKRSYKFTNIQDYKIYKINISSQNGYAGYVGIDELYMYKKDTQYKKFRSLSSGCAYLDVSGNSSLTNKSLGAWPPTNEWDKYIINSDLKGKVTKGDDNIWHYKINNSWCKDTPLNGGWNSGLQTATAANSTRINRGNAFSSTWPDLNLSTSTVIGSTLGFRPVLNYVESDIASEVIY
ncbi:hypothetical protein psyc5s11_29890 [Clostridium gelidum]|uniref:F5/8 type C domain-containing protein n=1 Tax=Clostridium gelidum TaxID=704125 RepID=A0ABN6J2D0_9CLOT|nr:discoidin domain-containing protein [Clostridium gelidum]BCZ46922.1 hypothetical protein psyc5s11_29890 [Clostridium gelidum]